MKTKISKIKVNLSIGFLYWLQEYQDLRGLKSISIIEYPTKLQELEKQYNEKYPNGLIGWSNSQY